MDFLAFWGLVILLLIIIVGGIIFLSYWIPKRLGYKKVGLVISIILAVVTVLGILSMVFEDQLFFKSEIKEILSRHDIKLKDDFKIVSNSSGGLMDYYHSFELIISQSDRDEIIKQIKNSRDFNVGGSYLPDRIDRYSNTIIKANFEDANSFKRESYQTFEVGYAPTLETITIDKNSNRLRFEQLID